jgi:hypothetical protein
MKDKLNQDILVGSYIAYGHSLGRCAALKIGRVLKVNSDADPNIEGSKDRITVVGVDDDMSHWDPIRYPPKLSKVGTLQYPSRVIVINPELVSVNFRELLDAFVWVDKSPKKKR